MWERDQKFHVGVSVVALIDETTGWKKTQENDISL